jgi:hypothetical protein
VKWTGGDGGGIVVGAVNICVRVEVGLLLPLNGIGFEAAAALCWKKV